MKRWPLNKAHFWEKAPFFRMLLPFVVGIFCYNSGWLSSLNIGVLLSATVIFFAAYLIIALIKRTGGSFRIAGFVLMNATVFLGGICIAHFNDIRNDANWYGKDAGTAKAYIARITDAPVEKETTWKIPVTVINSINGNNVKDVTGNAFLYAYKDGGSVYFHKGDTIIIPAKWQPIKNAGNPFEFDYAAYCRQNNIYLQQFLSGNNIRLYATNDPTATSFTDRSHEWCMQQLAAYIKDSTTKGLIQAMLLGDEVNLDENLRQSYSETGIVHIIAISGGNVAIFFIAISFLLSWIRNKKFKWISYLIALPLVWFYVVMAGAQPSAIRAALMFSLLAAGIFLEKNNNSLNQLFATAMLLLCIQPMWLFALGFQLSFVAVLSIILFYRPIYRWYSPRYKITKLLWSTVVASIAAEILVAPLVIYYFHTFPLLFIIANVIAYLFMSVVLILGIAIIALSFIPTVAEDLGWITTGLVKVFDRIVVWLQGLNPVPFHFLQLSTIELLIVYAVISGFAVFLFKRNKVILYMGMSAACLLLVLFCINEYRALQQQKLVVYNISKAGKVELINGKRYGSLYADSLEAKKIAYTTKPTHIYWQAWLEEHVTDKEVMYIGDKSVLLLNEPLHTSGHFPVDYVIVNYKGEIAANELQQTFSPQTVVLTSKCDKKMTEKYKVENVSIGVKLHTTSTDGAFVLQF